MQDKKVVYLIKRTNENNTHFSLIDNHIEEITSWKFHRTKFKKALIYYMFSLGLVYILCRLSRRMYIIFNCVPSEPMNADYFMIKDKNEEVKVLDARIENFYMKCKLFERVNMYNLVKHKLNLSIYTGVDYTNKTEETITFTYHHNKYMYIENKNSFISIQFDLSKWKNQDIHNFFTRGVKTKYDYNYLLNKFGTNTIPILNKSYLYFFKMLLFRPEIIFQFVSVVIWSFKGSYIYSALVLFFYVSIILTISFVMFRNFNSKLLKLTNLKKIKTDGTSQVIRDFFIESQNFEYNSNANLVPGDIFNLKSGDIVPCDCVVLDGICTVNEADLNGESCLLMKTPLPNDSRDFIYQQSAKSILYEGTRIFKCESNNGQAIVTVLAHNTGINTLRANLIQNMLATKRIRSDFNFSLRFLVIFMSCICVLASLALLIMNINDNYTMILIKLLNFITFIVHPSLPLSILFSCLFSIYRLNIDNVSCRDRSRLEAAGQVQTIVLDKTGTLTVEDLDIYGFQTTKLKLISNSKFLEFDKVEREASVYQGVHKQFWRMYCENTNHQIFKDYQTNLQNNIIFFLECLATCHSIDKLKGDYLGNSIDKRIFDSISWNQQRSEGHLLNSNEEIPRYEMIPKNSYKITEGLLFCDSDHPLNGRSYKLKILKRFEFSSKFQSMSVIVENTLDDSIRFYIKGAPEKIIQLCSSESLPLNIESELMQHTKDGLRVLACATKLLERSTYLQDIKNPTLEDNLTFLGFIIFKNKLKTDTKQAIIKLKQMKCDLIMSTGDNPFTSISVARESEIIEDKPIFLFDLERDKNSRKEVLKLTSLLKHSEIRKDNIPNKKLNQSHFEQANKFISLTKTKKVNKNENKTFRSESADSVYSTEMKLLNHNKSKKSRIPSSELNLKQLCDDITEVDLLEEVIINDAVICISGKAFEFILDGYRNSKLNIVKQEQKLMRTATFLHDLPINYNYLELIKIIRKQCKIYFRMSPQHKIELIKFLKEENNNKVISMCGDGANDSGALLESDVGIAIGEKDKNTIMSHFYSNEDSISAVVKIISAGRACYENYTITCKFIITCSVIRLLTELILFSIKRDFLDIQWLFIDFFCILLSSFLSSKARAGYRVDDHDKPASIRKRGFLLNLIGHIVIQVGFLLGFFYFFINHRINIKKDQTSYSAIPILNSYAFIFSMFQYLGLLISINLFSKYRESLFANRGYIFYTSILVFYGLSQISSHYMDRVFFGLQLTSFDIKYQNTSYTSELNRLITIALIILNFGVTILFEFICSKIKN